MNIHGFISGLKDFGHSAREFLRAVKRVLDVVVIWAVIGGALLWIIFNFSEFLEHPFRDLFILTVLCLMALGMWFWDRGGAPPAEKQLPPLSTNYGNADFAPQVTGVEMGIGNAGGVFFGKSSSPDLRATSLTANPGAPICSQHENHTLISARARTGKGTRVIIPTLLRYSAGSAIIIDPRGTNAAVTARARAALGSKVHILNPWDVLGSKGTFQKLGFQPATLNPLDILDRNDPKVVSNAMAIAGALSPSKFEKDKFWKEMAARAIAGVLLWMTDKEGLPRPGAPPLKKTLRQLSSILNQNPAALMKQFETISKTCNAWDGAVPELLSEFIGMTEVTFTGITANIAQVLSFLVDPMAKAATDTSSFSIEDLYLRPTSLYLVIPPELMDIQRPLLRMVLSAALQAIRNKRPETAPRCMFLIDEFPALGHLDFMQDNLAQLAEHGVDFVLVVQGIDQLHDIYGDSARTIMNNCAYQWYCNLGELQSAKHLSETLGKKTVRTTTKGETKGKSEGLKGGGSESESDSTTYGEMGKDLLSPDEIINQLGRNVAILLAPNSLPHYLRPVDYWDLPSAFGMFRDLTPQWYWQPPLQFDANPLRAGDTGSNFNFGPPQRYHPPASNKVSRWNWRALLDRLNPLKKEPKPVDLQRYAPKTGPPPAPAPGSSNWDPTAYAPKPQSEASPPPRPSKYDPSYYSPENIAKRSTRPPAKPKRTFPPLKKPPER